MFSKCNFWLLVLSLGFPLNNCLVSKQYLDTLLAQNLFKGYDLIVSLQNHSLDNLLSWLYDQDSAFYSLTLYESNLSSTLDRVRTRSHSVEQIAILIEFRNISHLEEQLKNAKQYSKDTSVPQPVFFVLVPSPTVYEELLNNEEKLSKLSLQFSINSDFYFFGESHNHNESTEKVDQPRKSKSKTSKSILNNLEDQGFTGQPFPGGFELSELYSLKNQTFYEPIDLKKTALFQKVIRRYDFRSVPIVAVAEYGYPAGTTFSPDNTTFTSGYEVDQLNFLARSFNFTVKPKMGEGWMHIDENGKLTGMGDQLIRRDADIAISSSEMLTSRAVHLSFLHPTYYTKVWAYFKPPASNSMRDIFINAFTVDLWLTMFATWLLIIAAMFALAIVKWKLGTLQENDKIVISEVFIWATGAICQQGWHVCPESGCLKIVFIFALITGLVAYVGYSAALVSILSVKVVPIQSISDLINHQYTIYNDRYTIGTNDIVQDLAGRVKILPEDQRSITGAEGIEKIMKSKSTFLGVADMFYPTALNTLCTDVEVCKNIQQVLVSNNIPIQGGMFLRKRSSFTDFFNHRILLMYERGIRNRLMKTFFRDTSVFCLDLASEKEPLGFNDIVTAYVILFIGYVLSLSILLLEKVGRGVLNVSTSTLGKASLNADSNSSGSSSHEVNEDQSNARTMDNLSIWHMATFGLGRNDGVL